MANAFVLFVLAAVLTTGISVKLPNGFELNIDPDPCAGYIVRRIIDQGSSKKPKSKDKPKSDPEKSDRLLK
ncbi:MAG: hypothetical protein Kow00121_55760 [Elainellaceae cyanobacterium]